VRKEGSLGMEEGEKKEGRVGGIGGSAGIGVSVQEC